MSISLTKTSTQPRLILPTVNRKELNVIEFSGIDDDADRVFSALTVDQMYAPKVPFFFDDYKPFIPPVHDISYLYDEDDIAYSKYFDEMLEIIEEENKILRDEIKLFEMDARGDISLYD